MFKLGHIVEGKWVEHSHPATFQLPLPAATQRIVAGLPGSDPDVVYRLARLLIEPLVLLYILHTPRGEAEPGRYQSPELPQGDVGKFFSEFQAFLSSDARFDLWIYSPEERATIVWDRHNLIYAYGPLDSYARELKALGFTNGEPRIPMPHEHNFHREFDEVSKKLIGWFDWRYSPLRPEDDE